jgi:hypothetical protein
LPYYGQEGCIRERLPEEDGVLKKILRPGEHSPADDHDPDPRPAFPHHPRDLQATGTGWHVHIGHEGPNVLTATFQDPKGLITIGCLTDSEAAT